MKIGEITLCVSLAPERSFTLRTASEKMKNAQVTPFRRTGKVTWSWIYLQDLRITHASLMLELSTIMKVNINLYFIFYEQTVERLFAKSNEISYFLQLISTFFSYKMSLKCFPRCASNMNSEFFAKI